MIDKITPRLGTRGELLLWCAVVWLLFGARIVAGADSDSNPALLHLWLPEWFRVALWWVPVPFALYAALHHRWAPVAVAALVVAPAIRAGSYAWAWLTYYAPVGEPGMRDGLAVSMIYLLMVGLVWITARVKETTQEVP